MLMPLKSLYTFFGTHFSCDKVCPIKCPCNDLTLLLKNTSKTVALAGFMIDPSQKQIHLQSTQMKVTPFALSFKQRKREVII